MASLASPTPQYSAYRARSQSAGRTVSLEICGMEICGPGVRRPFRAAIFVSYQDSQPLSPSNFPGLYWSVSLSPRSSPDTIELQRVSLSSVPMDPAL